MSRTLSTSINPKLQYREPLTDFSGKVTVLLSGGLDSFACLLWALYEFGRGNVQTLYIDVGQRYAEVEKEACGAITQALLLPECQLLSVANLVEEDLATGYIPFRNTLFLLFASLDENAYGIVFGAIRDDNTVDSNPSYIRDVTKLFSSQRPAAYRTLKFYTPFRNYDKTQLVKWLKEYAPLGLKWSDLTIGCYNPQKIDEDEAAPCGNCMCCFNRWVAMSNNNFPDPIYAVKHPFDYMVGRLYPKRTISRNVWTERRLIWQSYRAMDRRCRLKHGCRFAMFALRGYK